MVTANVILKRQTRHENMVVTMIPGNVGRKTYRNQDQLITLSLVCNLTDPFQRKTSGQTS